MFGVIKAIAEYEGSGDVSKYFFCKPARELLTSGRARNLDDVTLEKLGLEDRSIPLHNVTVLYQKLTEQKIPAEFQQLTRRHKKALMNLLNDPEMKELVRSYGDTAINFLGHYGL